MGRSGRSRGTEAPAAANLSAEYRRRTILNAALVTVSIIRAMGGGRVRASAVVALAKKAGHTPVQPRGWLPSARIAVHRHLSWMFAVRSSPSDWPAGLRHLLRRHGSVHQCDFGWASTSGRIEPLHRQLVLSRTVRAEISRCTTCGFPEQYPTASRATAFGLRHFLRAIYRGRREFF